MSTLLELLPDVLPRSKSWMRFDPPAIAFVTLEPTPTRAELQMFGRENPRVFSAQPARRPFPIIGLR